MATNILEIFFVKKVCAGVLKSMYVCNVCIYMIYDNTLHAISGKKWNSFTF